MVLNNLKVHHIGYLVKNIHNAISEFQILGYNLTKDIIYDGYRDVSICFLSKDGMIIELVSPASEKSVVYNTLKKTQNSPYHICYEIEESCIIETSKMLIEQGYLLIVKLEPAPAIDENLVEFYYNKNIGMIEVLYKR